MINKYVFVFVLLLTACTGVNEENSNDASSKHLENKALRFALDYPKNWTHTYEGDTLSSALLTIQTPLDSGGNDAYQENITLTHEVLPMRIDDSVFHFATIREIMLNNHNTFSVKDLGRKKMGANNFREYTFSFKHDSSDYVVHGYTFYKDSVGYRFSYTSTPQAETKFTKSLEGILSSFKPL
jgi:hypothetical protein